MKLLIIRIGIVLFFAFAVLQGVIAGRDIGHKAGEPEPAPIEPRTAPVVAHRT